ncbi:MAG: hypothetical protein EXR83_14785 [Gammaproteobacteria bacterium]|nr:hypothetical protein [Gammaproteobacteria bacterium]
MDPLVPAPPRPRARTPTRTRWQPALALIFSGAALAQAVPQPVPAVGSQADYSGRLMGVACPRWTTLAPSAEGVLTSVCGGYVLESALDHDLNPRRLRDPAGKTLVEFTPHAPALQFPLALGRRWTQRYVGFTAFNNLVWEGETTCEVAAQEPLALALGEVASLRIECEDGWQVGPRSGHNHTTRWYAPALGIVVKEIHARDPARWNFELTRYALAAPAAPNSPALGVPATPTRPPPAAPPAARPPFHPEAPSILDPNEY